MASPRYVSVKFEVWGKVQGVFFRKHAKARAVELGLTGWCRNTPRGTVDGEFEYRRPDGGGNNGDGGGRDWAAEAFRHWLSREGSPRSRIDRCEFGTPSASSAGGRRRFDGFRVVR